MGMAEYTTPGGPTNANEANSKHPQPSQSILQRCPRRPVTSASGSPIFDDPLKATSLSEFNYRDYGVIANFIDKLTEPFVDLRSLAPIVNL